MGVDNLNGECKLLRPFKNTESISAQASSQSRKPIHPVKLILTVCVLFLVLLQIAAAQTVHIPDTNLRAVLASALDKEVGTDITQIEMASLEALDAFEAGISDLTGLEFAINLTNLHLGLNKISDVSPLKTLTKLRVLDLHRNQRIVDVSPLKTLTKLVWLSLRGNRIVDASPLSVLTNLTYLHIGYNSLSDAVPFKTLTNLTFLNLDANRIVDVSPLSVLTNLTNLALDDNRILDVSPLSVLTNLRFLNLNDNRKISDVSPLSVLTNLRFLDLHGNEIVDVSPLSVLTNLTNLRLQENQISDVSPLEGMTKLTMLALDSNEISDVSPLRDLINLTELDLHGNEIVDVSPLRDMTKLTVLDLHNNHILDFSPIAGLVENLVEYNNSGQTPIPSKSVDVNRDGIVNVLDLVLVASHYHNPDFSTLARFDTYPDVNDDGVVDVLDLVAVAAEMHAATAAPALKKSLEETSVITVEKLTQWIVFAKQLNTQEAWTQRGIAGLEHLLAVLNDADTVPEKTTLLTNYPNPFNPETWIPYQLSKPSEVTISIHAADGKLVRVLVLGRLPVGVYHEKSRAAYWNGRNEFGEPVASGIYFYTLTTGDFTATRKMLIRK